MSTGIPPRSQEGVWVRTEPAAVCSVGIHGALRCNWFYGGSEGAAEDEMAAAAEQHAAQNPGHKVTCQVKQIRTWSVLRNDPEGN